MPIPGFTGRMTNEQDISRPARDDREQIPTGDAARSRDDTTSIDPRSDPPTVDEDGKPIDDGMGAEAALDVAGEDEPVDGDESNPLEEANSS